MDCKNLYGSIKRFFTTNFNVANIHLWLKPVQLKLKDINEAFPSPFGVATFMGALIIWLFQSIMVYNSNNPNHVILQGNFYLSPKEVVSSKKVSVPATLVPSKTDNDVFSNVEYSVFEYNPEDLQKDLEIITTQQEYEIKREISSTLDYTWNVISNFFCSPASAWIPEGDPRDFGGLGIPTYRAIPDPLEVELYMFVFQILKNFIHEMIFSGTGSSNPGLVLLGILEKQVQEIVEEKMLQETVQEGVEEAKKDAAKNLSTHTETHFKDYNVGAGLTNLSLPEDGGGLSGMDRNISDIIAREMQLIQDGLLNATTTTIYRDPPNRPPNTAITRINLPKLKNSQKQISFIKTTDPHEGLPGEFGRKFEDDNTTADDGKDAMATALNLLQTTWPFLFPQTIQPLAVNMLNNTPLVAKELSNTFAEKAKEAPMYQLAAFFEPYYHNAGFNEFNKNDPLRENTFQDHVKKIMNLNKVPFRLGILEKIMAELEPNMAYQVWAKLTAMIIQQNALFNFQLDYLSHISAEIIQAYGYWASMSVGKYSDVNINVIGGYTNFLNKMGHIK